MRLSRPVAVALVAAAAFLPAPAHATQGNVISLVCGPDARSTADQCDPFWLFRPCGPLVWCP